MPTMAGRRTEGGSVLGEWAADRRESLRRWWPGRAGSPVWSGTMRELNPVAVLLTVLGVGSHVASELLPWVILRAEFPNGIRAPGRPRHRDRAGLPGPVAGIGPRPSLLGLGRPWPWPWPGPRCSRIATDHLEHRVAQNPLLGANLTEPGKWRPFHSKRLKTDRTCSRRRPHLIRKRPCYSSDANRRHEPPSH